MSIKIVYTLEPCRITRITKREKDKLSRITKRERDKPSLSNMTRF